MVHTLFPRYLHTIEEEIEIDGAAVDREIEKLEAKLAGVRGKMKSYLIELGV